jgi:hypothetical protein
VPGRWTRTATGRGKGIGMSVIERGGRARTAAWGWGIIATLSGLLIVNALWLYAAVGTPAVFEADTGVSLSELRAAYPGVADELTGRGRTIAVLLGGLGALAVATAIAGMRTGSRWASSTLWVFVAALLAVAANALAAARVEIGAFYLAWAVLSAFGLLLSGRDTVR